MNIPQLRISMTLLTLCVAVSACILPGQPASSSAPTADTVLLSTMVAETVVAARTQTAAPRAESSETAQAASGMTGTNIEKTSDGSTKYTDSEGGFEMVLPVGWLAVRPNTDEFNEALTNEGADNPMLRDQMAADQAGYEASFDRLYSYPLRPDIQKNVIFGFSKLTWDPEDQVLLDNNMLGELVRNLEGQGGIPGFRASIARLITNVNDVQLIEISGPFALDDGQGGTTPFYATIILFKPTPDSLARMTFTMLRDYQESISADVQTVIASIKLLQP